MDWKAAATAFAVVFVAELGDKTQLATLSLAAGGTSRWSVFAGSAVALVLTSLVAVLVGEGLARAVEPRLLQRVAGASLLVMGGWFLWSAR